MRKIYLIIGLSMIMFASCSQKISKLDYDKQAYEYQQLQLRYELLKKEQAGNTDNITGAVTSNTRTTVVEQGKYTTLQNKYETLLEEKVALEKAYNATLAEANEIKETTNVNPPGSVSASDYQQLQLAKTELQVEYDLLLEEKMELEKSYKEALATANEPNSKTTSPPGSVPATNYKQLQVEKTELEKRYVILEKRYKTLKESMTVSTINSAELVDAANIENGVNASKGIFEESSLRADAQVITRASYNGLYFEYDTYSRNNDYLILDIAVKNNSQSNLKTIWQTDKIEITDLENRTLTANSFRVGVNYVDADKNVLTKRIKDENTVFARFAFEDVPADFNLITNLKFTVIIDGEERIVELAQLDIVEVQ